MGAKGDARAVKRTRPPSASSLSFTNWKGKKRSPLLAARRRDGLIFNAAKGKGNGERRKKKPHEILMQPEGEREGGSEETPRKLEYRFQLQLLCFCLCTLILCFYRGCYGARLGVIFMSPYSFPQSE